MGGVQRIVRVRGLQCEIEEARMQPQKPQGTPYKDMKRSQKVRFVLKVIVCVLTFGLAFPNVMGD